jgi:hypothetical protein
LQGQGFGYKNGWIAAKGVAPAAAAEALSLRNVRPAGWPEGIEAAYEHPGARSVFITPPVDGWVLCVGLPIAFLDMDEVCARLTDWAARLGTEVQFFATHRVTEAHFWARARPSGLERAYGYVGETGETVMDQGPRTAEELALDLDIPDEGDVMALAAAWSVDPTSFEERDIGTGDGLLADMDAPPEAPRPAPLRPAAAKKPWWKLW